MFKWNCDDVSVIIFIHILFKKIQENVKIILVFGIYHGFIAQLKDNLTRQSFGKDPPHLLPITVSCDHSAEWTK